MTRNLRWWIGGLLFASTIINYIDRQTLSVLAPFLKDEYKWTNTDFATVLISFRIAYTIFQSVSGRVIDRLGTRRGLPQFLRLPLPAGRRGIRQLARRHQGGVGMVPA